MDWKTMLAYITGSVDEDLLLRNEYLAAENRILRAQIKGRLKLTDGERRTLAEIGKKLGRKTLAEVATIVKPETILAWHRMSEVSRRLDDIPGIGPLIATALVASVPDPHAFKSGRDLAAWIGLVPRQNSTGGKDRLGHISKAGNRYLRMQLVVGALSVIRRAQQVGYTRRPWLTKLLQRRSTKVAAIALANKNARTAWAMMAHGTYYQEPVSQAA